MTLRSSDNISLYSKFEISNGMQRTDVNDG